MGSLSAVKVDVQISVTSDGKRNEGLEASVGSAVLLDLSSMVRRAVMPQFDREHGALRVSAEFDRPLLAASGWRGPVYYEIEDHGDMVVASSVCTKCLGKTTPMQARKVDANALVQATIAAAAEHERSHNGGLILPGRT